MANWDFARSITGMRLLAELGVEYGLQMRQCLAGTSVREKDLNDPAIIVSADQELRLIRNLLNHLPQVPALGIEAGMRYHYTTFGMLGFAMATSPNARKALEVAMRYFNLTFAFSTFEASDTELDTIVRLDVASVPEDVQRFVAERDSAALVTVQRELIPIQALKHIYVASPKPNDMTPYELAYGITPEFNKPQTIAILDRQKILLPLTQANDLVRKFSEEQCAILLERHRSRLGLAAKVRECLARNVTLNMESVAENLFMTSRTLRRKLDDEGISFAAIRDEVLAALAEEYLVVLKLSVEETSYRLGFSSSPAFITAFRRLTGTTPLAFKKHCEANGIRALKQNSTRDKTRPA